MNYASKQTTNYMIISAILALILGTVMLLYPGGTMSLINATFWVIRAILTIFILVYTLSVAMGAFKSGGTARGVIFLIIATLATVLVWIFDINLIFTIIAIFLIVTGIFEIGSGFTVPSTGRYFLMFLGLVNVMVGILIIRYPVIVPLLLAWYVVFWGISRLFLALELRKIARE